MWVGRYKPSHHIIARPASSVVSATQPFRPAPRAGHGVQHAYAHIHDLVAFTVSAFNISHVINSVSFGEEIPVRRGGGRMCVFACLSVNRMRAAHLWREPDLLQRECARASNVSDVPSVAAGSSLPPGRPDTHARHGKRHAPVLREAGAHGCVLALLRPRTCHVLRERDFPPSRSASFGCSKRPHPTPTPFVFLNRIRSVRAAGPPPRTLVPVQRDRAPAAHRRAARQHGERQWSPAGCVFS